MVRNYLCILCTGLSLVSGSVWLALVRFPGILHADSSLMIIDGSISQQNPYSLQSRQRYQQQERNYEIYGSRQGGYYSAQNDARGNYINRMAGYFGPKGVNLYESQNLNRALQYDQSERQRNLSSLNSAADSKMRSIYEGYRQAVSQVVDPSGQLSTYDTGRINDSAERLKNLAGEAEQFQNHLSNDFRREYKELVLAPYLEKSDLIHYSNQIDGMVNRYIYGGNDYSGVTGLKNSLSGTSSSLVNVASQIKDQEDEMRNNLTQSYVLGGLGLALSLVAAIPSAGTSLAFGAKLAIGAGIVGGTTSLGNTIRTNVVLNEKGIDGFRSSAESKAQVGLQAFQYLTSAVSIGSSLYQLGSSVSNATVVTSNVGGSASGKFAGTMTATAWSGMSASQRSYMVFQGMSGINNLTDIGGLKENAIGKDASYGLNAGFALGNMLYNRTNIPSDVSKTIQIYGLSAKQGIQVHEAETLVNNSVLEPFVIARKDATYIRSLNRTLSDIGSTISIVQGIPEGRSFLRENWFIPAGYQAFGLYTNLTERYQDYDLNKSIEKGQFTPDHVMRYFDLDKLSNKRSESYLQDKDNEIYAKAAIETARYHNQTTLTPYSIEKKTNHYTTVNYVSREISFSDIKDYKLNVNELALFASLYKRNPLLNPYQNPAKRVEKEDLETKRYVIDQCDFEKLGGSKNIDEILNKYKPIQTLNIYNQQTENGDIVTIQQHQDLVNNKSVVQIQSNKPLSDPKLYDIINNLNRPYIKVDPIPRIELNRGKP